MVRRQHLSLEGVVAWYVNASDGEKAATLSLVGKHKHAKRKLEICFIEACYYHMRDMNKIICFLTLYIAKIIATSLIGSKLGYCNSVQRHLKGNIKTAVYAGLLGVDSDKDSSFLSHNSSHRLPSNVLTCNAKVYSY